jgi:hypothetical protein
VSAEADVVLNDRGCIDHAVIANDRACIDDGSRQYDHTPPEPG